MNVRGWQRLWFVGCVALLSLTLLNVFITNDLSDEKSGVSRCFPGSVSSYTERVPREADEFTQAEAKEAFAKIRKENPSLTDDEVGLRVGKLATEVVYDSQTLFACTSYSAVFRSILVALLLCLLPALAFIAVRWVWRGFRGRSLLPLNLTKVRFTSPD